MEKDGQIEDDHKDDRQLPEVTPAKAKVSTSGRWKDAITPAPALGSFHQDHSEEGSCS